MKRIQHIMIGALTVISLEAHADYPQTDLDFMLLPPYCKIKLAAAEHGADAEILRQQEYWARKLGEGYGHIHHYCEGLHALNRAYYLKEPFKSRELKTTIGGVNYVLKNAQKNFSLMPDLHTTKAQAYVLMNQPQDAINELNIAIEKNPKYSPAYYHLSRIYLDQKKKTEAIEILKQGISHNPESKLLTKKLDKIK
ncbi:MAG: tetratricopeptide repeat protein [Methylomonas sp.]|nr:tetratricopeptide repeat protein [Methylomonas sp.]PPD22117.1 MAG: hypothetical protein CTY23_03425 [Methylomonas sp.]PPD42396.1 MAG: hypothetical protein CTY17_01245 [Methylomonas sp.]PPD53106.1 MAG: hypothetical protein CTY11_07325 [Methylomonas sp.]